MKRLTRVSTSLALAMLPACGGSEDGDAELRMPALTEDFGTRVYEFLSRDSETGELSSILLYSDGLDATIVVLRDQVVDRPTTTRLRGTVLDTVTVAVSSGQVNVDANHTFADNEVVPGEGYVVTDDQGLSGTGIRVGTVVKVGIEFHAMLAARRDLADVANALFD